jgi:hypothetical protein
LPNTNSNSGSISLPDRLERIEEKLDGLVEALAALRIELAVLKTKAAIWGGGAGLVLGALVSKLL